MSKKENLEKDMEAVVQSLDSTVKNKAHLWRKVISEVEALVGSTATIEETDVVREISLWCFVVEFYRVRQSLYPKRNDQAYTAALKLLEQKGVATQEKFGHYLIWFRAAGRFKDWPDDGQTPGVRGQFAAVLFTRLFNRDPYRELVPDMREKVFKQFNGLLTTLKRSI